MCGFVHSTFVTTPDTFTGFEPSYSAAKEWWAATGAAAASSNPASEPVRRDDMRRFYSHWGRVRSPAAVRNPAYNLRVKKPGFLAFALLQLAPALSPASLVDDVRKISVATTNEQRFDALTGLLRARNIPFTVEPFTIDKPLRNEPRTEGRNIVVTLGEGAEEILVGAHYDAVRLGDGSLSRGAVDNAGSSVMLVRLADALRSERLARRVRVVWFDMEELGLIGSTRYLAAHAGDRITTMLNFDINAYGDTILFGDPPGGDSAPLRTAILQTCAEEQADCMRFGALPNSDDRPFGKAGIPTLSIAMLPAAEAHQLWLLLEGVKGSAPPAVLSVIHTAEDVIEKVDGASIARMHRFALALLKRTLALP
jgi:hypothetical protein